MLKKTTKICRYNTKILVEGHSKNNQDMLTGRTDTNKVVIFEGPEELIGK